VLKMAEKNFEMNRRIINISKNVPSMTIMCRRISKARRLTTRGCWMDWSITH
jgi:hypothetical protein